jgi:polyhydroxybutyrate depolymerase
MASMVRHADKAFDAWQRGRQHLAVLTHPRSVCHRPRILFAIAIAMAAAAAIGCGASDGAGAAAASNATDPGGSADAGSSTTPDAGNTAIADATTTTDAATNTAPGPDPDPTADNALIAARPYKVQAPASPSGALPLIVELHGYSDTAAGVEGWFKLGALVESQKVILAIPDGTKDSLGLQFWNAGKACCNFDDSKVDDVAYLMAVIHDVERHHTVDRQRVFVIGHSNGAFMAHTLACRHAESIAAIVSLAGAAPITATDCATSEPVAVLQVHGDADEVIDYGGGTLFSGAEAFPSAAITVGSWAARNGCAPAATDTGVVLDLVTTLAGSETHVATHSGCKAGSAAELWTVKGGTHVPELQAAWAATVYGFVSAHPKL